MCLPPKKHQLETNQYLNSLKFDPLTQQMTLLVAPTGVGKTTFTMEDLTSKFDIVFTLVPSVFKVQELETEYGHSRKKVKNVLKTESHFFYGNKGPKPESLKKFKGVIVSTYDKFTKIKDELPSDLSQTILVLDECHKLYSVGSFRDSALTPIIIALQQKTFPNVLALTATFTQDRWRVLDIAYDQKHIVTKDKKINHELTVIDLIKGDQYSFVHKIIARIESLELTNETHKKIIVRINHREKCEISAKLLTEVYNLKCLVVHSKVKDDEAVQQVFDLQKIPKDIQVVFTTSILDEAVNINNPTEEIDSVFMIGKTAHPEEVVQFMGRLRYAEVPYFIVLHTGISTDSIDIQKQHLKNEKRIKQYTNKISKIADLMSSLAGDLSLLDQESDGKKTKTLRALVNQLNSTMESLCGCKLFAIHEEEVVRNYASIAALNYRQDKSMCFENFEYLTYRLLELNCQLNIQYELDDTTQTEDRIKEFFKQQQEISRKQALESIDDAAHIFLNNYSELKLNHEYEQQQSHFPSALVQDPEDYSGCYLKYIASLYQHEMQNDDEYLKQLVYKMSNVKYVNACTDVLSQIIKLAGYIGNLADIKKILLNEDDKKVLQVAHQYENNLLVIYMLKRFYRYSAKNCLKGEAIWDASKAQKICIDGIESLKKTFSFPMKTIISKNLIAGLTYDNKNDQFTITSGKAFNFIAQYFDVDDINKNKPKQRYLKFKGIAIGGYQYQALNEIQSSHLNIDETIDIKGVTYKNQSGVKVFDETLIEDMGEDVFDETPNPAQMRKIIRPKVATTKPLKKLTKQ